nr:hypothetical protein [Desulfobacterales bacterium]
MFTRQQDLNRELYSFPRLLDGLFPSPRASGGIEDLEEERRLFYVTCTRAREQL